MGGLTGHVLQLYGGDAPQRLSDGTGLVFRSPRGKPLSNMTLSKLIKGPRHRRSAAWFPVELPGLAAERTSIPREVVEAALAHTVQNPTEAACARSGLFERRHHLMDDSAGYLDNQHRSDNPIGPRIGFVR